jgi:OOP family OmpA-OmpF porin
MLVSTLFSRFLLTTAMLGLSLASLPAHAQSAPNAPNQGFQLNRYEPTAAGEWSFAVDHPWYSGTRYFAAGLTLNYAHQPLVYGIERNGFTEVRSIYDHQFIGHVDLAGSFLDRVLVTASLPIVFTNQGEVISDGASVGDPRLGALVRLYGQPYASVLSISVGATVWLPLGAMTGSLPAASNDRGARFTLPKIVLGGVWNKLLWSTTLGFMYRSEAVVADSSLPPDLRGAVGGAAASEIQLGISASYFDQVRRFAVGPEILLAGAVMGRDSFSKFGTSLEAMIAGHYNIMKMIQVGLALGGGFVRQAGTPDFRMLLRVAYAPTREKQKDTDGDGIYDKDDACPTERGVRTGNPQTHGCPPVADRDADGVLDPNDLCPDEAQGFFPDPMRLGCPLPDRDKDAVLDRDDVCPDTHKGEVPDPNRLGCPMGDRDGDGVLDAQDLCPDVHKGQFADPRRLGCPAPDTDADGILDPQDLCPQVPAGLNPDPARLGCPQADRDKDNVPDAVDACPDKPGSPNTDPKKNGCPGLVVLEAGRVRILKPVFFAFDKDVILAESFPTLQAVAEVLKAVPTIRRLRIEGHTDGSGNRMYNIDLSDRRAASVLRWLIAHGIDASRLYSQGFGPDRPIDTNATTAGRAKNRRVVFEIVEGGGGVTVEPPR